MPKPEDVQDESLRSRIEGARDDLRSGRITEGIHTLADAYLWMMRTRPAMLEEKIPMPAGRTIHTVLRWPDLGADLVPESVEAGEPRIEFRRDRFSLSEGFTYYEFLLDTAVSRGF